MTISQPTEFEGMNWLPEPDPHVRVFDMLESTEQGRRWIMASLFSRPMTLDHLRTSLWECFPFTGREMRPDSSTRRLWDRRVVELSFDASMGATAAVPLVQSVGSLGFSASGRSSKALTIELADISVTVANRLVLLDEHLERTKPMHASREFYKALIEERIYVVVAAYYAGTILLQDSASRAAEAELSHSAAVGLDVSAGGKVSRSSTLLFQRTAANEPAAFGIKVRQIGFDPDGKHFRLGHGNAGRVRGAADDGKGSDLQDSVLSLSAEKA